MTPHLRTRSDIPRATSAARIAQKLADLADEARMAGFDELADALTAAGIEAAEEARHAHTLLH
jgi:hypothetical protein